VSEDFHINLQTGSHNNINNINIIYLLLYNRTRGTTNLKSKYTVKLIRMQRDLAYSKLTRNQDRPTQ